MSRWTQEDIDRIHSRRGGVTLPAVDTKPLQTKYRNERYAIVGEGYFDSKKEAQTWAMLKTKQDAGLIWDLQRQVSFPLNCPVRFESICGFAQVSELKVDFVWNDSSGRHVADCKGIDRKTGKPIMTKEFCLKVKWLALQDGITVEIL